MSSKTIFKEYLDELPDILTETGVDKVVSKAHTQYVIRSLEPDSGDMISTGSDLNLLSLSLENIASEIYLKEEPSKAKKYFDDAFLCRRNFIQQSEGVIGADQLFKLSVSALGSERSSELRLTLQEHELALQEDKDNWAEHVRRGIVYAFLLLCRKGKGWKDVNDSIEIIEQLRSLQKDFENKYLNNISEESFFEKRSELGNLIALYNLAKIIEITAIYLVTATPANPTIKLRKHYENALEALGSIDVENFADMLIIGCELLIKNSIWTSTRTLGKQVRDFISHLASENKETPFIELLPSQQEAIRRSLFDSAKKSIVLEMPTSAGKTLMREIDNLM